MHVVIGAEVKTAWLAAAWMGWTAVLTEASLWWKADDLRRQSYLAGASAVIALVFGPMAHLVKPGPAEQWMVLAICAVLAGVCAMRLWLVKRLTGASTVHAMGALGVLLVLSWAQLPEVSVVLAWMALALLVVEAGLAYEHPVWPVLGHAVAMLGFGRLFVANFTNAGETAGISHRIVTVLPASAAFAQLWHRCREEASARLHLWAATAAVVILMRFELGRVYTIAGWAPLGVLLLVLGLRWKLADLRWQSYALAVGVAMRGLTTSFDEPSSMGGLMTRLAVAGCAIACLYAQEFLAPRLSKEDGREWLARPGYSVLASLLVALVLYREISGSVLTVAWGLEGVLLLAAGFPARERVLRVSGLAGLMVCILKLFFYDLRNLETLPRIFSFMVLGLLLLAVSWGYTRFQERLRRML